ncbi:hypothetical protein Vafri_21769 [Volvox africanus]|uniref:Uncharacterized protein n=1 Tax=Volvox africanus TaxID=51714 RepID=A0A8J4BTX8_9CHLO|nr:hypothetical protein Vafri_21769 [Volvox africanus]
MCVTSMHAAASIGQRYSPLRLHPLRLSSEYICSHRSMCRRSCAVFNFPAQSQRSCDPAHLPTCPPAYLPTCLPAYLPTCLPALTQPYPQVAGSAQQPVRVHLGRGPAGRVEYAAGGC